MWIVPNRGGLEPNYGSHSTSKEERANRWCSLVSPVAGAGVNGGTAPVQINQDASIRVSELDAGTSLPLTVPEGRQAYLLCMEGAVDDAGGAVGLDDTTPRNSARVRP